MGLIEKLYARAPYFLQNVAANYIAIGKQRQRWNPRVRELLALYQQLDWQDYDGRFDHLLRPDLADATATKAVVNTLLAQIVDQSKVAEWWATSGTSGSGMRYAVSEEFIHQLWAFYWKFRAVHGVTHADWFVYFIGKPLVARDRKRPPYWIYARPTRQLLMSQYHLSPATCPAYVSEIERSGIRCLHGYPSTIAHFANLIEEGGLGEIVRRSRFRFISCSSERLLASQKDLIERVFDCRVVQIYGMTEGVVNAYECEQGRIHLDEYFSKVDFEPAGDSGILRLYGSSYHNAAMPLYRYAIGDHVRLSSEQECPCGRKGRLLAEIIGREEDYVIFPDGRKIGRLDHIFKNLTRIDEAQIVQRADFTLVFHIVRSSSYSSDDERQLREEILAKLGDELSYVIKYVDMIERTPSGKLKAVISEVNVADRPVCATAPRLSL